MYGDRQQLLAKTLFRPFRAVVRSVIDFVYPPYCIACHSLLNETERLMCENCWHQLPGIDENLDLMAEIRSKSGAEIYFSKVIAIWEFSPHIQTIIHHLKYQNFQILAGRIGRVMAERIKKMSLFPEQTILVPIPLHQTRLRERGYNQSALLCNVIAAETGLSVREQILERIRYTESQTKLMATDRIKNVENAFKVNTAVEIKDKIIILVDDVITTGATINACAKELVANGAGTVYIVSAVKA